MPKVVHREPLPEKNVTPNDVLKETRPSEHLSRAAAEQRLAEILAHINEISRQLEDKSRDRARAWAGDPHAAWRGAAMQAREELRRDAAAIRDFLDRVNAPQKRAEKEERVTAELKRQEISKSTTEARKLAKKSGEQALWNQHLRTEVALLAIVSAGGEIGPLGESLLYSAQQAVPSWYRDYWLRTEYETTWGRQAKALHEAKNRR